MRLTRIAKFLVREAVHYDPETRQPVRHPERNFLLTKYRGQPDVFGTFTAIVPQGRRNDDRDPYKFSPKLGVNPSSKYNTPVGIYCYPIDFLIESYKSGTGEFDVPFPINLKSREYLHVFRVTDLDRCLVFRPGDTAALSQYKESGDIKPMVKADADSAYIKVRDLLLDFNEKLKARVAKLPKSIFGTQDSIFRLVREPLQRYFDQLRDIDQALVEKVNQFYGFKYFGFNRNAPVAEHWEKMKEDPGVVDDILDNLLKTVDGYFEQRVSAPEFQFPYEDRLTALPRTPKGDDYFRFRKTILSERVLCDQAYIWNATRHLSGKDSRKWMGLLRQMGFIGAIDHGTDTIHHNEPTQAVFFDSGSLKTLIVLHEQPKQYKERGFYEQARMTTLTRDQDNAIKEVLHLVEYLVEHLIQNIDYYTKKLKRSDDSLGHKITEIYREVGWLNTHARKDPRWNFQVRSKLAQQLRISNDPLLTPDIRKKLMFLAKITGGAGT